MANIDKSDGMDDTEHVLVLLCFVTNGVCCVWPRCASVDVFSIVCGVLDLVLYLSISRGSCAVCPQCFKIAFFWRYRFDLLQTWAWPTSTHTYLHAHIITDIHLRKRTHTHTHTHTHVYTHKHATTLGSG